MTPAPLTPPDSLRTLKRTLAPFLVIAILAAAAWRENRSHPLDFWSHSDGYGDYVNLSLAHALNIDFWVSKASASPGRQMNDTNTLHPGFPLQATSWAAYRLSSMGKGSDAASRCVSVLTDPSDFWRAIRVAAIAIGLICSALFARAGASHGFLYAMAIGLVYFCYEPAWDYSIRLLGNETFAMPLALAVAWVAGKCLNPSEQRQSLKWWAGWGSLCALCWLNKLNYIAWTVAAIPAVATYIAIQRPAFREIGLRLTAFGCGFIVAAYSLATVMLGWGGLSHILRLHFGVLTHSGSYGNGPEGAVSASAVRGALHSLAAYWSFLGLAGIICALSAWVVLFTARRGRTTSGSSPYLVYLLCTVGLFLAATLKHYGPHYLVAGVPAIALLMLGIAGHLHPRVRLALSVAVGLVLIHSYRRYSVIEESGYRRVTEMKASLRAIDELPGRPGDAVLWTYRLPEPRFVRELVQYLAGVPEVGTVIDEKFPSPDKVYFIWNPGIRIGTELVPFEKVKWRYAVFERGNYEHFLTGSHATAREYFERHCRKIIDGPVISLFERVEE